MILLSPVILTVTAGPIILKSFDTGLMLVFIYPFFTKCPSCAGSTFMKRSISSFVNAIIPSPFVFFVVSILPAALRLGGSYSFHSMLLHLYIAILVPNLVYFVFFVILYVLNYYSAFSELFFMYFLQYLLFFLPNKLCVLCF